MIWALAENENAVFRIEGRLRVDKSQTNFFTINQLSPIQTEQD